MALCTLSMSWVKLLLQCISWVKLLLHWLMRRWRSVHSVFPGLSYYYNVFLGSSYYHSDFWEDGAHRHYYSVFPGSSYFPGLSYYHTDLWEDGAHPVNTEQRLGQRRFHALLFICWSLFFSVIFVVSIIRNSALASGDFMPRVFSRWVGGWVGGWVSFEPSIS